MWWYVVGIIAELLLLSFISGRYIEASFVLLMRIVRSRTIAVTVMTIVLFPGTVIHELSHLFTAEILGVRTGKLTLAPESIEGNDIQSGSVAIAKTDPFRRTLIGIAPFVNGIAALTALSWWFTMIVTQGQFILLDIRLSLVLIFYLILTISTTMFTSKEDMAGVIPVLLAIVLLAVSGYIAGIRISLTGAILQTMQAVLVSFVQNLGIVLAINLSGVLLYSLLLLVLRKRS